MVALGTTATNTTASRPTARPPRQFIMVPLIARRIAIMIPTLLGIVTITFILTHALSGDPAREIAGQAASPATLKQINQEYGFDKPILVQYWDYITGILHGSLGKSTVTTEPVLHDLVIRFPSTLELIVLSLAVAWLIGVPLGAYAGRTRARVAQSGIRAFTFVVLAIPDFWLALVALYFFFFKLGWLPAPTGQVGLTGAAPRHVTGAALLDSVLTGNGPAFVVAFTHAILPVGVLGLLLSAPITRLMRGAMLTSMESDFIRFGTSVGLGRVWLWRYAVRASIPTVITFTGTLFTLLLGGTVLIESIFSWGGAAQYAATSIGRSDFSATQGFVLACGFMSMISFLVIDIVQLKLDPRIRQTGASRTWRSVLSLRTKLTPSRARAEATELATEVLTAEPLPAAPSVPSMPSGPSVPEAAALPPSTRVKVGRFAAFTEAGQVIRELVLDMRPRNAPAAAKKMLRNTNAPLIAGATIVIGLLAAAYLVPMFWKYGPLTPDILNPLASPSMRHPFGTDNSGFDIFVRVIYAARTDLAIAAAGVFISAAAGVLIGLLVGYSRRQWLDDLLMRIVDMVQAFPVLIIAVTLVAFAGNSLINVVWALTFINIPIFLRLARAQVLTVREMRYIEAARAIGNSRIRILVRHVLPNTLGQVIVQIGISLGYALLTVAGLAFLGVGIQAPSPEWGSMILTGKDNITTGQWWTVVFPGLGILIAVAGFNLLADGIEKARDIYR